MTSDWDKFKQSNIARILIGYSLIVFAFMQVFDYLLPIIERSRSLKITITDHSVAIQPFNNTRKDLGGLIICCTNRQTLL